MVETRHLALCILQRSPDCANDVMEQGELEHEVDREADGIHQVNARNFKETRRGD